MSAFEGGKGLYSKEKRREMKVSSEEVAARLFPLKHFLSARRAAFTFHALYGSHSLCALYYTAALFIVSNHTCSCALHSRLALLAPRSADNDSELFPSPAPRIFSAFSSLDVS